MNAASRAAGRAQAGAAQKLGGAERLAAGALQFDQADRALAAGDGQFIVEHHARRARAGTQRGAQDLQPLGLATQASSRTRRRERATGRECDYATSAAGRDQSIRLSALSILAA